MDTVERWDPLASDLREDQARLAEIAEAIAAAERELREIRRNPVGGRFFWLKRLIHKSVNSAFIKRNEQHDRLLRLLGQMQAALQRQHHMLRALEGSPPAAPTVPAASAQPADELAAILPKLPGFSRVFNKVAQLRLPEAVLIYALVYGLKPRRMLEIGTAEGGSSLIACGAMDDSGLGSLFCIDLQFRVSPRHWSVLRHRTTFIQGPSPDSIAEAASAAGAGFDLAFIDGDHTREGLLRDISGVLPYLSDCAHLLFHDSYHAGVREAIAAALEKYPELTDCGELSSEQTVIEVPDWGTNLWAGLRLLRYHGDRPCDRS